MTKWKWVALPVMAMLLLSLLPQVHLWLIRGRNWNGAYVSSQGDELLYSAYIRSLGIHSDDCLDRRGWISG